MKNNAPDSSEGHDLPEAAVASVTASASTSVDFDQGARAVARVLIIAAWADAQETAADSSFLSSIVGTLESANFLVSTVAPAQWQQAVSVLRPTLVLLEASQDVGVSAEICRELKSDSANLPVLAIFSDKDAATHDDHWQTLREAGADDFIAATASTGAWKARALLLTRLANTQRENTEMQGQLSRHKQIDDATQLLNRRSFFQSAQRECSRARRYGHALSCLMVDIEYLDDVAKLFGYGCVEYVLRAVAYAVRQWTRDSDVLGRFNERKFVVLLPETDVDGAVTVREKILGAIAETQYTWEGQNLPISVSIGETERRYQRMFGEGSTAALEQGEGDDAAMDESGAERLTAREELASLLEDADAALNVARRSSMRPNIFVQYTPTE